MEKKLKVLQINKYNYLKGGSERSFFDVSKILKNNGHEVITFSMKDSRNESSRYEKYFIDRIGLEKFSLKNIIKYFWNFDASKKLEELIKNEKPDIAHLHNIAHQLSPSIIHILNKYNIPIIQTLHDYKLICPNYRLYNKNKVCLKCKGGKYYKCFSGKCIKNSYAKSFLGMLEAYLHNKILKSYNLVDLYIAPSGYMKEVCVEFGVPSEKILVLKHSINNKYFIEDSVVGDYFLYFGRLSKEKGVDTLIDAMSKVNSNMKLKIVGAGEEFKNLEFRIKNLGFEDKIEIVGPKYGEELIDLIKNAKAVIMPSVWPENMPYSLLESMALGKTVIASHIGGISEMINNRKTGFLFKHGSGDELAKIINNLDNFDLEKIGKNAKERVKNLNENKFYKELISIYSKLFK